MIYKNTDTDIAVLSMGTRWPWLARTSLSLPDSGAQVKIIGWTKASRQGDPSIRVTLDLHVLGSSESGLAAAGDVTAQVGFSGGPVLDVSNGKLVGIVYEVSTIGRGNRDGYGPEPIRVTYIRPISVVPAEYR